MSGGGPPRRRSTADVRTGHIPVLLSEMVEALQPKDGETYIDGTFGAGGYSRAILQAADCRVLALDRDPSAVRAAETAAQEFPNRLTVIESAFADMEEAVRAAGISSADGVVLDVGVSSMQLDDAERGFSFQADGPLDMRMGSDQRTAADVVNGEDESTLADVIYQLGEERRSRAIARAIVKARSEKRISRTGDLADLVSRVFGGKRSGGLHPATRTFQALRIFVNDELGQLARGLSAAERLLRPGGRLVVVTFHSLEDRIIKRFLALRAGKESAGSRHRPQRSVKSSRPSFRILNSRPLTPSKGELEVNPRARSARLRAGIRTEAPAWPLDMRALGVPVVGH